MTARYTLSIAIGAPGAGKSSVVEAFLAADSEIVVWDSDWLIESASLLAGKDIHFASETWVAYNQIWFDVIHSVMRNGRDTVLFAPIFPGDVEAAPAWCSKARWFLLDCPDMVLRQRLEARGWDEVRISESIADAQQLRLSTSVDQFLDTSDVSKKEAVDAIAEWVCS